MTDERFVDALFFRSWRTSFTRKDENTGGPPESYQTFLRSYPSDPRSQEAALSLFQLNATTLASARIAYTETMSLFPAFARRDALLLRLGALYEKADSLHDALNAFTDITHGFPGSPSAEEAGAGSVRILAALGPVDSAIAEGTAYLAAYPADAHTAEVLAQLAVSLSSSAIPRAVEMYQRLNNEFPYAGAASNARRNLADALVAQENFPEAIALYSELLEEQENSALAENGTDPSLLLALGNAYQRAGDTANAKKYLFQVLAREQTGETAWA
jgi:tetratricopeptide (TPR) repeat protein